MAEEDIDISKEKPKNVDLFVNDIWDYVITVCDEANEACPVFNGRVKQRLHLSFRDPSDAKGSEVQVMTEFRMVRDGIKNEFRKLFDYEIKPQLT